VLLVEPVRTALLEAVPVKFPTNALADLSHKPLELAPVNVTSPSTVKPVSVPREVIAD
jgi:hypothetical protein